MSKGLYEISRLKFDIDVYGQTGENCKSTLLSVQKQSEKKKEFKGRREEHLHKIDIYH